MGGLSNLTGQLQSNWLPIAGVVVVWLVYRLGKVDERRGVLHGLREELRLHAAWVGNAYPPPAAIPIQWQDPTYMVNKVSTVGVDNAVARGPALFLNRDLLVALVGYRQVLSHFHQLIDSAMALQANAQMWTPNPPPHLLQQMTALTTAIHVMGIGTETSGGAHQHFLHVTQALQAETDTKVLPIIWLFDWNQPISR